MKIKYLAILIAIISLSSIACNVQKMGLEKSYEAGKLANEYISDIGKGNRKFKGNYLTVSGQVWQSYSNKYNENIIILMPKENKYGVKCVLSAGKQLDRPLKQGEFITINGKCDGFDDHVVLRSCILLKNKAD